MSEQQEKSQRTQHKVRGLGSIHQRTEGGSYHIQFSVSGKQYRESAHTDNYNKALRTLKRRHSEVMSGTFAGTQVDPVLMSILFEDVISDYELMKRHSVDNMAKHLITKYLLPHFGEMRAVNITIPMIRAYMAKQDRAGRSIASVNRELAMLRRSFTLGVANGRITRGPSFRGLLRKEKNARQGFWEHHEYEAFRDALPLAERGPFVFGYWTGCRLGEILALEWKQVDLATCLVRLRADQTKSSEPRTIPLGGPGADLYDMLVAQKERRDKDCPKSPYVFFRAGGEPVQDIRKAWAKASETTKITRLFHDLRRTGVRNLVRAGVPEKVAMQISGHKTRSVFERYNVVDERDLHDAADKLYRHLCPKKKPDEEPEK